MYQRKHGVHFNKGSYMRNSQLSFAMSVDAQWTSPYTRHFERADYQGVTLIGRDQT